MIFPYPVRGEQQKLMDFVSSTVMEKPVCVNATTGFGKTSCILSALLPFRRRVIWAVRTGNESDRPIEELRAIDERASRRFFGLSYRGKKDMCLLKEGMDYDSAAYFCKKKMGACKYHKNLSDFSFSPSGPLLYSELFRISKKENICPYYFQRALLPYASVLGMSYNYVLSDAGYSLRSVFPFHDSFLVVDEAHNLERVALGLNSIKVTQRSVERAIGEVERIGDRECESVLKALLDIIEGLEGERRVDMNGLIEHLNASGIYEKFLSYGDRIRDEEMEKGAEPRSSLYHAGQFFQALEEKSSEEGVVLIATEGSESLELYDMRSRAFLSDVWDEFLGCVFCSGTLEPVEGFAETMGLKNHEGRSFYLPFRDENIKAYILKGISTEGEVLSGEMCARYVEQISDFLRLGRKSAVFCSSYRVMDSILDGGLCEVLNKNGTKFLVERQSMGGADARGTLEDFRALDKGCLIASAQGRFAEGIDLPHELDSIFIAGVPFERMDLKMRLYIDYCMQIYGSAAGRYYSYTVPAIRKAAQAMGRALRSEDDKALIVCGDERYARPDFFELLPHYFRAGAKEITHLRDVESNL